MGAVIVAVSFANLFIGYISKPSSIFDASASCLVLLRSMYGTYLKVAFDLLIVAAEAHQLGSALLGLLGVKGQPVCDSIAWHFDCSLHSEVDGTGTLGMVGSAEVG